MPQQTPFECLWMSFDTFAPPKCVSLNAALNARKHPNRGALNAAFRCAASRVWPLNASAQIGCHSRRFRRWTKQPTEALTRSSSFNTTARQLEFEEHHLKTSKQLMMPDVRGYIRCAAFTRGIYAETRLVPNWSVMMPNHLCQTSWSLLKI